MKNLVDFVAESSAIEKFPLILTEIKVADGIDEKSIVAAAEEASRKLAIASIEGWQKAAEEMKEFHAKEVEKDIQMTRKAAIKAMQSKPGILKRKPEAQEKWIQQNIDKSLGWLKERHAMSEKRFDEFIERAKNAEYRFNWYHNLVDDGMCTLCDDANRLANSVMDSINDHKGHKTWDKMTSIVFCVAENSFLFKGFGNSPATPTWPQIKVVPMFPEDIEKELSRAARGWSDAIAAAYDSGKYIGD